MPPHPQEDAARSPAQLIALLAQMSPSTQSFSVEANRVTIISSYETPNSGFLDSQRTPYRDCVCRLSNNFAPGWPQWLFERCVKRMHPKRARPKGTQTSLVCRSFAPLGLFFANYGVRGGIVGFYAEKLLLTAASIAQLAKLIRVALRRIAVNAKAVRSHNPGWFPPKTPQKGAAK